MVRERVWVVIVRDLKINMIGRRFAETEIITHLSMIMQRYTIHLKNGWTKERVWEELHGSVQSTTFRLQSPIPLVFKKR
jgi:hypothetical protein